MSDMFCYMSVSCVANINVQATIDVHFHEHVCLNSQFSAISIPMQVNGKLNEIKRVIEKQKRKEKEIP